jgi:hypothetical protein
MLVVMSLLMLAALELCRYVDSNQKQQQQQQQQQCVVVVLPASIRTKSLLPIPV